MAKSLRPGRSVDIVLHTDLDNDLIDNRTSILHDINSKGYLVLGQTSPPIPPSSKGKTLEITFLSRYQDVPGGRWLRVGYHTPLLGVIQDYQVGPKLKEPVLVVAQPKELKQVTLRLHYRLEPPAEKDLRLYLEPGHQEVGVVDISQGGVKFYHSPKLNFEPRQTLRLNLCSEELDLILKARVVTMYQGGVTGKGEFNHTAVSFKDLEVQTRRQLANLLNGLLRYNLARRSGVLKKEDE
jgi:hypothetical protein